MKNERVRAHLPTLGLLLTAIIWGAGFIATQMALDSGFSPGLVLLCRFGVATAALLIGAGKHIFPLRWEEVRYGLIAGVPLFLGFYTQILGLRLTTPSNNGFFTATSVIMVPLIAWALHHKRPPAKLIFCSLLALTGFFILSWRPGQGFSIGAGDLLTLLGAFFFACHIVALEILSTKMSIVRLTFLQMAFAGGFSLLSFLALDLSALDRLDLRGGLSAVVFLGLFSTCLCFMIQTWAQSKTSSGKAAVVMSSESLWCMLFSVLVGYETLSAQMSIGGILIVGAVCLLELEIRLPRRNPFMENRECTVVASIATSEVATGALEPK